jgi:FkbM family methyltransferase
VRTFLPFGFGGILRSKLPPWDASKLSTPVGRFTIYGPQGDTGVMQQVIQGGEYERHVVRSFQHVCSKDSIVLDVGANVGIHSLPLSRIAYEGTIHAFEACKDPFAFLEMNLRANKATNVVTWKGAVCNVDGQTIEISYTSDFAGGAFISTVGNREGRVESVRTLTLDGWADRVRPARIDFIKMDIEGAECLALQGARQLIRKFRPTLIVECNATALHRCQKNSPAELFELLQEHYPAIAVLIEHEGQPAVCDIKTEQQLNTLIEWGQGLEDLLCSYHATDLPRISFQDHLDRMQKRFGRINLLPHSDMLVLGGIVLHRPAFSIEVLECLKTASPRQRFSARISLVNTGKQVWSSEAPYPVNVSYYWRKDDSDTGTRDGLRTALPAVVKPGDQLSLDVAIEAPVETGVHECCVSLVHEGLYWFDQLCPEGVRPFRVQVT